MTTILILLTLLVIQKSIFAELPTITYDTISQNGNAVVREIRTLDIKPLPYASANPGQVVLASQNHLTISDTVKEINILLNPVTTVKENRYFKKWFLIGNQTLIGEFAWNTLIMIIISGLVAFFVGVIPDEDDDSILSDIIPRAGIAMILGFIISGLMVSFIDKFKLPAPLSTSLISTILPLYLLLGLIGALLRIHWQKRTHYN